MLWACIEQWLREEQVLSSASLEWGMWLMSFLMTEAPEIAATGALHHKCVKHVVMRLQRIVGVLCLYANAPGVCGCVLFFTSRGACR